MAQNTANKLFSCRHDEAVLAFSLVAAGRHGRHRNLALAFVLPHCKPRRPKLKGVPCPTRHMIWPHGWFPIRLRNPWLKDPCELHVWIFAEVACSTLGLAVGSLAPSADRAMAIGGPAPRRR